MFTNSFNNLKKHPFSFFLIKLLILISIIYAIDFIIGNSLRYFYFKQKRGAQYLTTYSIEKAKADILIFGSSRANHHYNPAIFEKELNMSCYNNGKDGQFIFYHCGILKSSLKRYTPKAIILDFFFGEFSSNQASYDRLSALLPYYRDHYELHTVIELKSPFEKLKLLSNIYPFNSSMLSIAGGNELFSKKVKTDINGFLPIPSTKIWEKKIQIENDPPKYEIDTTKIRIYESFIQNCLKSKIKLYIICSPRFIKLINSDYSIILAQEIAKKYKVPFFDFSQDTTYMNDSTLFADEGHLNNKGADLFSKTIVNILKSNGLKDIK
jgi:hypothetical protein